MSVYACADLHGSLDALNQILNYINKNDIVYFLGDANDRGLNGWEMIKMIYNDPRFIYLKGNHEQMLIDSINNSKAYNLFIYNGGSDTYKSYLEDSNRESWINSLNELPTKAAYINKNSQLILLSHAGFTPRYEKDHFLFPSDFDLLWDRCHRNDQWPAGSQFEDVICVHGHTPTFCDQAIIDKDWEPGALYYCRDHKICIDNGIYMTGYACLLNLDTFEEKIFEV